MAQVTVALARMALVLLQREGLKRRGVVRGYLDPSPLLLFLLPASLSPSPTFVILFYGPSQPRCNNNIVGATDVDICRRPHLQIFPLNLQDGPVRQGWFFLLHS